MIDTELRLGCLKIAAADFRIEKEKEKFAGSIPTNVLDVTVRAERYYQWILINRKYHDVVAPSV